MSSANSQYVRVNSLRYMASKVSGMVYNNTNSHFLSLHWDNSVDSYSKTSIFETFYTKLTKLHCVKSVPVRSYSSPHFPSFGLNTERYYVSLHIQSKCGKMRTRITPKTETFYAVLLIQEYSQELFFFYFYVGFLSQTFTNHRAAGEGGGHFINSSLPLPPASQTLRHQPGDYCRELTSAHRQQPDSNQEPFVSERKLLTTKLRALKSLSLALSEFHFLQR